MIAAADYDAACWIVDHGSTKDGTTPENGFASQASKVEPTVRVAYYIVIATDDKCSRHGAWHLDAEGRL